MTNAGLERLYATLDITTLNDLDSPANVREWSRRIQRVAERTGRRLVPAAICVYATHVEAAKEVFGPMGIPVASVAGNFPSGKASIPLKVHEVSAAVLRGADEIDLVIDRGLLLEQGPQACFKEVQAVRGICAGKVLKVILESGQIADPLLLGETAHAVLEAGADFLKTSTGKSDLGATPTAAAIFCRALNIWEKAHGEQRGFKASGGIRTLEDAQTYMDIYLAETGRDHIDAAHFRIGASGLANAVIEAYSKDLPGI